MYKLSYEIEKLGNEITLTRWYHLEANGRLDMYAKKETCGKFDTIEQAQERIKYFNSVIDWAGVL